MPKQISDAARRFIGREPNQLNERFRDALFTSDYDEIYNLIHNEHVDVNTRFKSFNNNSPLQLALGILFDQDYSSEIKTEIARLLLANGADPNGRLIGNWTPLHSAVFPDGVRILWEYGADLNAVNDEGQTPYETLIDLDRVDSAAMVKKLIPLDKVQRVARTAAKKSKLYSTWLLNNPNLPFGVDISEKIARDIARGSQFGKRHRKTGTVNSDIFYLRSL